MPEIECAETIKVAVTGSVPPMDYVAGDGIDFENKKLRDSTFKASLLDEVMTLQCKDEYFENVFTLEKIED